MYVPRGEQITIAAEIYAMFMKNEMRSFSYHSADLYKYYGEYTADEIMKRVRRRIVNNNSH